MHLTQRTQVREVGDVAAPDTEESDFLRLEHAAAVTHRQRGGFLGEVDREDEQKLARARRHDVLAEEGAARRDEAARVLGGVHLNADVHLRAVLGDDHVAALVVHQVDGEHLAKDGVLQQRLGLALGRRQSDRGRGEHARRRGDGLDGDGHGRVGREHKLARLGLLQVAKAEGQHDVPRDKVVLLERGVGADRGLHGALGVRHEREAAVGRLLEHDEAEVDERGDGRLPAVRVRLLVQRQLDA
mmetsp:Transcript_56915/g.149469  ORF Transcript_56915/g.149469 Transcript_56915/m.149469 type:complete len:243 (-) Transcript_56915:143-871(-)